MFRVVQTRYPSCSSNLRSLVVHLLRKGENCAAYLSCLFSLDADMSRLCPEQTSSVTAFCYSHYSSTHNWPGLDHVFGNGPNCYFPRTLGSYLEGMDHSSVLSFNVPPV